MRRLCFFAFLILTGTLNLAMASGDLFQENFDDGYADGFTPECPLWEISAAGTYHIEMSGYEVFCWSFAGDVQWTDYTYSADIKSQFSNNQMVAFRVQANGDCYFVNLRSSPWNDAVLTKWVGGTQTHIFAAPFSNSNDTWHAFKISVLGPTIQFDVDGQEVFTFTDEHDPFLAGNIGVVSYTGGVVQTQVLDIDNIMVDSFVVPVTSATLSGVKALYR